MFLCTHKTPSPGDRVEGHDGFGTYWLKLCRVVVCGSGRCPSVDNAPAGCFMIRHYMDDFVTMGATGGSGCESTL